MITPSISWTLLAQLAAVAGVSFVVSVALIVALWPLFERYWVTNPNARSSHRKPTPQGGGIAVIAATTVIAAGAILALGVPTDALRLVVVLGSTVGLAVVGAVDDMRPIEALPRLVLQAVAAALIIATLPAELRVVHALPWWAERALMFIAILWFVNLVNFMDGIDWITVAEVAPMTLGLSLFGLMGTLPQDATIVATALCGAIIGFAPFNRPVARLFLGDVGSLPIGLLLSWMLILLATNGHLAAALLLPLYYLADATITMLRRLLAGERIMQAHRSHFYQRATDRGLSVSHIVGCVFGVNILLVGLAAATLVENSPLVDGALLTAGGVLVGVQIWHFNRTRA